MKKKYPACTFCRSVGPVRGAPPACRRQIGTVLYSPQKIPAGALSGQDSSPPVRLNPISPPALTDSRLSSA